MNDTMTRVYPDHVLSIGLTQSNFTNTQWVDKVSGSILLFCLVFGTTSNVLALVYFVRITSKSLAEKLYSAISFFDLTISIVQTPVMISLLCNREPMMFLSRAVCGIWIVLFEYLQRISIYMIVLLSVTRTLAIVRPFAEIKERVVMISVIPYSLFLLADVLIGVSTPQIDQTFYYLFDFGYAIKGFHLKLEDSHGLKVQIAFMDIQNLIHSLQVVIPSIVVFVSFVVALIKLSSLPTQTSSQKKLHRASMTISLATAAFLTCNIPFFVMLSFEFYDSNFENKNPVLGRSPIAVAHLWSISKVVFVSLNASINPVLYFFRIRRFKRWILSLAICRKMKIGNGQETLSESKADQELGSPSIPVNVNRHSTVQMKLSGKLSGQNQKLRSTRRPINIPNNNDQRHSAVINRNSNC